MDTNERKMPLSVAEQIFGTNKAPVADVVKADFEDLFDRARKLVAKVAAMPAKVKDKADFAAVGALANEVRELSEEIELARRKETDPLRDAGIEIKSYFDIEKAGLADALQPHMAAANGFAREEQARELRQREDEAKRLRDEAAKHQAKAETGTGAAAAKAEGKAENLSAQAEALEAQKAPGAAVKTKIAGGGSASAKSPWTFEIKDYNAIDLNSLRAFIPRDAVEQGIRSMVRVQKEHTVISGVRVFQDIKASFRK